MNTVALDTSRDRVLKAAGDDGVLLAHATAARMVAAWALDPAPRDPAQHLEAAHVRTRPHLERLAAHDPAREIYSPMTNEMYARLTDARPAPLTRPAGVGRYTYTPRKVLRRVLDHALDHLNQIDQWLAWQRYGVVPTPTDGWAPSTVTLPDDMLPLEPAALEPWLWRVDQTVRLVAQRAAGLSQAELDWQPPDGGWPLRRVLHHLASCERLYGSSLEEALRHEDPVGRYEEACRRLDEIARETAPRGADGAVVYTGLYGATGAPEDHVGLTLTIEGELLAGVG